MSKDRGDLLFVWKFDGPRHEGSVDLRDLPALIAQRTFIVEFTKQLMLDESRVLPPDIDDRIRLVIYAVGTGSSPVAVYQPPPDMASDTDLRHRLFVADDNEFVRRKVKRATAMAAHTTRHIIKGEEPPYKLTDQARRAIPDVTRSLGLGDTVDMLLPADAANDVGWLGTAEPVVDVNVSSDDSVRVPMVLVASFGNDAKQKIDGLIGESNARTKAQAKEVQVTCLCEVTRVNVRARNAAVDIGGNVFTITFSQKQESEITKALHEHERSRLRLIVKGLADPDTGDLQKITSVLFAECVMPQMDLPFGESGSGASVSMRLHAEPVRKTSSYSTDASSARDSRQLIDNENNAIPETMFGEIGLEQAIRLIDGPNSPIANKDERVKEAVKRALLRASRYEGNPETDMLKLMDELREEAAEKGLLIDRDEDDEENKS
jgi:hypothetical protein